MATYNSLIPNGIHFTRWCGSSDLPPLVVGDLLIPQRRDGSFLSPRTFSYPHELEPPPMSRSDHRKSTALASTLPSQYTTRSRLSDNSTSQQPLPQKRTEALTDIPTMPGAKGLLGVDTLVRRDTIQPSLAEPVDLLAVHSHSHRSSVASFHRVRPHVDGDPRWIDSLPTATPPEAGSFAGTRVKDSQCSR